MIPRQGWRGSYAVADFTLTQTQDRIERIFVIKVINGEERDCRRLEMYGEDPEEYRDMIGAFQRFIGYLPLTGHHIREQIVPILEDAYGVCLGRPFSNTVIDTGQMAFNHLPDLEDHSLNALADCMSIEIHCDTEEETRCRIVWRLYCRMEG